MPAQDPWGSGTVSWRERMERAYAEMRRRIKLEAKNDPNFVPRNNDASYILAARHFVVPPSVPERGHDDANDMLANRAFAKRGNPGGTGTPLRVPWTLVLRDALADFEARRIALEALIAVVGASYDWQLLAPDLSAILQVPTGTKNVEIPLGKLTVLGDGTDSLDATGHAQIDGDLDVTGTVTAPTFAGDLTGDVTGNVSGSAGSAAVAGALSGGPVNVTGAGSSPALHSLIAALASLGINLTDSTTP